MFLGFSAFWLLVRSHWASLVSRLEVKSPRSMSPLIIILLVLILVIGSGHTITVEKSAAPRGIHRFSSINYQNYSLADHVHFVNVSVGKNERDPSATMRNRLRQNLQHFLSTVVENIVQRSRTRKGKAPDVRARTKNFGKTVESNKIPVGEFPEDDGNLERVASGRRGDFDYRNIIGRGSGSDARDRLSKDLLEVSEALMPTVRKFGHVGDARGYRDERGNAGPVSRVKRQNPKNDTGDLEAWMKKDFTDDQADLKMHAFVVKDEEIPPCCSPAKSSTNRRYFMCSGAVLTLKHAITSASCIHYADVYESDVDAELAVLVGATEPRSYVIKINRYDMHPDYNFDVDAKNYAANNLAILFLACSIVAQDVVIPHLPKGRNDDVAHMCCREGCDLVTIMESPDNLHTARIVPAKHLPAPLHDEEDASSYRELSNSALESIQAINKPISSNQSRPHSRRMRSPAKLAAAPTFFSKESRRYSKPQSSVRPAEFSTAKKRKKVKPSGLKNQQRGGKRKKPGNIDDFINRRSGRAHVPIMRSLEKQGVSVEEELAAIDWDKVENSVGKKFSSNNREKMELFAKNVVDETMRRLENVLDDEDGGTGNGTSVFEKLMPNRSRNKTIENFVHVFTKVVSSILPPNEGSSDASDDSSLEEKDLKDPPSTNEQCPPVGTPVFANGTLVGLLAYTCDDVQNWVEWKYVNIAKNLNWIQKEMTKEHGTVGLCAGSEKHCRRRQPDDVGAVLREKKLAKESEAEIRGGKANWKRRETTLDARRSITAGNLDRASNPAMGAYPRIPKDPWFAKNSPPAPRALREDQRQRIFADSRNQPQSTGQHAPVYNVNTCYVKPDGTTDCQTRVGFNIR